MLTTTTVFLETTSLLVDVLVGAVLVEPTPSLTPAQVTWFTAYCDQRFRDFHANNPRWRKWLEDRDPKIDPRDQCKVWIRHWLAAYVFGPRGLSRAIRERRAECFVVTDRPDRDYWSKQPCYQA